jgi:hypothetical protein
MCNGGVDLKEISSSRGMDEQKRFSTEDLMPEYIKLSVSMTFL